MGTCDTSSTTLTTSQPLHEGILFGKKVQEEQDGLSEFLEQLGLSEFLGVLQEQLVDMQLITSGDLTETDLEKIGLPLGARKKVYFQLGVATKQTEIYKKKRS